MIQYLCFYAWLLSLSIMLSGFIHIVAYVSISFLFVAEWYSMVLFFFFWDGVSLLLPRAGMQWRDLDSPQPPPPGFRQFACPSLLSSGITGTWLPCLANFCLFSRDGVSPCWPGWSWTPDLKWSARLNLPMFWDYRCEPSHPASSFFIRNNNQH